MDKGIGAAHLVAAHRGKVLPLEPDVGLMEVGQILAVLERCRFQNSGQELMDLGDIVGKLSHVNCFPGYRKLMSYSSERASKIKARSFQNSPED